MEVALRVLLILVTVGSIPFIAVSWRKWYLSGLFDRDAWFVLVVWGLNVASLVAGRFTGSSYIAYGQRFGEAYTISANWVVQLDRFAIPATIVVSAFFVIGGLRRDGGLRIGGPAITALLIVVAGCAGSVLSGLPLTSVRQLSLVALLVASLVGRRTGGSLYGAAMATWLLGTLSGLLLAVNPSQGARACRDDKCGALGELYRGVFSNENALGLVLTLGLPFLLIAARRFPLARLGAFAVSLSIFLTGSRTSLIGLVACLIAFVLWLLIDRRKAVRRPRTNAALVIVLLVGLAAQLFVFLLAPSGAFTDRADLWSWGVERWTESWLFGAGWNALENFFLTLGGIEGASAYSLHNQTLDVLVIGGAVGGILWMILIVRFLVAGTKGDGGVLVVLSAPVWIGLLETPWSFAQIDWLSWVMVAAFMIPLTTYVTGGVQGLDRSGEVRSAGLGSSELRGFGRPRL